MSIAGDDRCLRGRWSRAESFAKAECLVAGLLRDTMDKWPGGDDPKVPHGFLVLAICEALRGDADSDHDGLVTIGELSKWVPPRPTDLAGEILEQEDVVVLPCDLAELPLTRTVPGEHKPLWTAK